MRPLLSDEMVMPYTNADGSVTFGVSWLGGDAARYRVTYYPTSGEVVAIMLLRHGAYVSDVNAVEPIHLAYAASLADVTRRLAGFEKQSLLPGGLAWARAALAAHDQEVTK